MPRITFLVSPECAPSSLAGPMDAFHIANLWWVWLHPQVQAPLFEMEIVSADGAPVSGYQGFRIQPERAMTDVAATDLVVVPGYLTPLSVLQGDIGPLCRWLVQRYETWRTPIAAICTGTFLLAETGLLDGRQATTNWQFARIFRQRYPQVHLDARRIMTEDAGLFCTGASNAFLNLCLCWIERSGGRQLAGRCAKALLADPQRDSQAPYTAFDGRLNHGDRQVLAAQHYLTANHTSGELSIEGVAGRVGLSPRHFKRRFQRATGCNPLEYLQRLRIEAARERLETTDESVEEITGRVGYVDANSFRRLFKKHTGLSPKAYRERFAMQRA